VTSKEPNPSPPLQLNVADSTSGDADLITPIPTVNPNTFIGGISADVLNTGQHFHLDSFLGANVSTPNNFNVSSIPMPPVTAPVGYSSPPRRLSLDERLEMEMGIKLKDEPKPQLHCYYPHPYFQHQYPPPQGGTGKFPPLPFGQHPPNQSGMEGHPSYPGTGVPGSQYHQGFGNPPRQQSQIIQVSSRDSDSRFSFKDSFHIPT
jgi:hypothetical protein